jgi:hypothetical protein
MGARTGLAAWYVLLAAMGIALAGCARAPWQQLPAKVNLPSPWATIKAAEESTAAHVAQDSSPRP